LGRACPFTKSKNARCSGGALFVASAVDTAELLGQFESEHNAQQACARDYARRAKAGRSPQGSKGG
jgi:hypothetical protein